MTAPAGEIDPTSSDAPPAGGAPTDRRSDDRRQGDRRRERVEVPVERRSGLDRRHQPDRRRSINQYDLGAEELEFIHAINRFKERTGKPFPTWSEVLQILRSLGYEKRV